jgi:hypothetical protein
MYEAGGKFRETKQPKNRLRKILLENLRSFLNLAARDKKNGFFGAEKTPFKPGELSSNSF